MDDDKKTPQAETIQDDNAPKNDLLFSKFVGDLSKAIDPNCIEILNGWLNEEWLLFVQHFQEIVNKCSTLGQESFNIFIRSFIRDLAVASFNPCVDYKEEDASIINVLNEKFNKSESIIESLNLFYKVKQSGIHIKEEYEHALFIMRYLDQMNDIASKYEVIDGQDNAISCLDIALQIMCSLFLFERIMTSKYIQTKRDHQFINAALKRREDKLERFDDYRFYIVEVENKWHPNGKKGRYGLNEAARVVFNQYKKKDMFRELFRKHYDINIQDEQEQDFAIKKFTSIAKAFYKDCLKHEGHSLNGYCPNGRPKRPQIVKDKISRGKKKNYEQRKNNIKQ